MPATRRERDGRRKRGEGKNAQFGIPLYQGNNGRRNPSWLKGCIYFGPSRWLVRSKNRSIDWGSEPNRSMIGACWRFLWSLPGRSTQGDGDNRNGGMLFITFWVGSGLGASSTQLLIQRRHFHQQYKHRELSTAKFYQQKSVSKDAHPDLHHKHKPYNPPATVSWRQTRAICCVRLHHVPCKLLWVEVDCGGQGISGPLGLLSWTRQAAQESKVTKCTCLNFVYHRRMEAVNLKKLADPTRTNKAYAWMTTMWSIKEEYFPRRAMSEKTFWHNSFLKFLSVFSGN